jgi:hypothetical protein
LLEGARLELVNKKFKRPEELTGSAKLYRVVDDVECARNCLSQVAIDVRNAAGNNQRY